MQKPKNSTQMLPAYAVVHLWFGQAKEILLTCPEIKHWTQFCDFVSYDLKREMDPGVLLTR